MTRARDRLYVCGWETARPAPDDCWYRLVRDALDGVARPVTCPFLAGDGEAIDPTVLRLDSAQSEAPESAAVAASAGAPPPLPAWALQAALAEPSPPQPLAPSRGETDPPVRSPVGGDDALDRFKRGTLVHALLQWLPELPAEQRASAARRYLARPTFELSEAQQAQLADEVLAVLGHDAFAELFSPASLAEVPISGVVTGSDGGAQVISGQIDRLLVGADMVTVVDYKTNRPSPQTPADVSAGYLRQMAAYRALLTDAFPGCAIRCCLLWTDGPQLMALPDSLLDEHLARPRKPA